MRQIITAICVNCNKEYKKFDIKGWHNTREAPHIGIRGCNTITCSKKCSTEFQGKRQLKTIKEKNGS